MSVFIGMGNRLSNLNHNCGIVTDLSIMGCQLNGGQQTCQVFET